MVTKEAQNYFFSEEYQDKLAGLSLAIKRKSEASENEATVVSAFDINLYSFIKTNLGMDIYPDKEKIVDTERHVTWGRKDSRGRIDSKYGAFIIEFKHPSKLKTSPQEEKATQQIKQYLGGLYEKNPVDYLGLVTDGTKARFVRNEGGEIYNEAWSEMSSAPLDRAVKTIVLLDQIALNSKNLVRDFCEPFDNSLAKKLTKVLFATLQNDMAAKTKMLFKEWQELFKLSHEGDSTPESQQRDLQERRESLAQAVDIDIKNNEQEYLALYALQTCYAIIVKLIAFKVISTIRFDKNRVSLNKLSSAESKVLQKQLELLEDGEIFRISGINNLLEGDYFSWYSTKQQWNRNISTLITDVLRVLSKYEDKVLVQEQTRTHDLFKELYQKIVPSKVRHSLGEFYTPAWLADNLISEALDQIKYRKGWKILDPTAGSGTFLISAMQHLLEEKNSTTKLEEILTRIKGIDLNPLSVLTARVNYFINISHIIKDEDSFEIPVYLGDSSYVPEPILVDGTKCLTYKIKTLKGELEVVLPESTVKDSSDFSRAMTEIEYDIKKQNWNSVAKRIKKITKPKDLTPKVEEYIDNLAKNFIELEKQEWNGIWARIVTNFLTTASLGRFDIIAGNPPWIDWKNLPAGYRDRIKSLCISRHLFSGDRVTGGINLNVCALISNVAADNWLKEDGVLGFLMPQNLLLLQTYEGFRNFNLTNGKRLFFQKVFDWTSAGHPFDPVQHKFLTYFFSQKKADYHKGVPVVAFEKKRGTTIQTINESERFKDVEEHFSKKSAVVGQCNNTNTIFTYANTSAELESLRSVSGKSSYVGREGIEFYPQELFLLKKDLKKAPKSLIYLRNYQNHRSKHKVAPQTILLEKDYLFPLVKGIDVDKYHVNIDEAFLVPFPYEETFSTRIPITMNLLERRSPNLAKYFLRNKDLFEAQTKYNDRIIGKAEKEFYALARVGKYSFSRTYVTFRDNTKWQAAVINEYQTDWGGKKRPVFQNHAVSICESEEGRMITSNEAHYICAILNAPTVKKYILNSSDSRSFKIRPPIYIPTFDSRNEHHKKLSELSIEAHKKWNLEKEIERIDAEVDKAYLTLCKSRR